MPALEPPAAFEPAGKPPRRAGRFSLRAFAVRRARSFESAYGGLLAVLTASRPLLERLGFERLERPVRLVERTIKGALFDCRMCGSCILSATGMSCPMNCPKGLRNGPCGGVRDNGHCEIYADMRCVWVEAWEGSRRMARGDGIMRPQGPIDHRLKGRSSWLAVARQDPTQPPEP